MPNASNDYAVSSTTHLTAELWNAVLADLASRIDPLEDTIAGLTDLLSAEAVAIAEGTVNNAVAASLASRQAELAALQQAIIAAEDQLAALQSGGVLASNVVITPLAAYPDITQVQLIIEALATVATKEEAEDGEDNLKRMTALRVKQAIDELAGAENTIQVTAATTLVKGKRYRLVAGAPVVVTLPANPSAGDTIRIVDGESVSATVQHTVARNGRTIMGAADNLILDVPGISVTLWYSGTDWRLF